MIVTDGAGYADSGVASAVCGICEICGKKARSFQQQFSSSDSRFADDEMGRRALRLFFRQRRL
jgi:hypothetical protein